jgi:hypothetical protein
MKLTLAGFDTVERVSVQASCTILHLMITYKCLCRRFRLRTKDDCSVPDRDKNAEPTRYIGSD